MKKIFYGFTLAAVCVACGGEDPVVEIPSVPINTDSILAETIQPISPALLAKFKKKTETPFIQDSTYLKKQGQKSKGNLTGEEVKYLIADFVESDAIPSAQYQLDDFFALDSLIVAGEEKPFVASEEGVNISSSYANTAQRVKLNDSTTMLLWTIRYDTGPGASPGASGTVLYASLLMNNGVTSCVAVGEDAENADAPYWSKTLTCCSFTAEGYQTHRILTDGGDVDEAGNEIVNVSLATYAFDVVNGVWEVARVE